MQLGLWLVLYSCERLFFVIFYFNLQLKTSIEVSFKNQSKQTKHMKFEESELAKTTIQNIWDEVKQLIQEEELHNYKIKEKISPEDIGGENSDTQISEQSLERGLVDVRKIYAAKGRVKVEERPSQSNQDRKVWIYQEEQDSEGENQ